MKHPTDTAGEPQDAAPTQPARTKPAREPVDAADMAGIARVGALLDGANDNAQPR